MINVLVPVDGSPNSLFAVRQVMKEFAKDRAMHIHLLNVQPHFSRHIARFANRKSTGAFHHEQAEKAFDPVRRVLDSAGVPYTTHMELGKKAESIAATATRLNCDHIVMSAARKNSLTRMLEASVTNRVLELTTVPVEVIAGEAVSRLENYGVPASFGAVLGLVLIAAAD